MSKLRRRNGEQGVCSRVPFAYGACIFGSGPRGGAYHLTGAAVAGASARAPSVRRCAALQRDAA